MTVTSGCSITFKHPGNPPRFHARLRNSVPTGLIRIGLLQPAGGMTHRSRRPQGEVTGTQTAASLYLPVSIWGKCRGRRIKQSVLTLINLSLERTQAGLPLAELEHLDGVLHRAGGIHTKPWYPEVLTTGFPRGVFSLSNAIAVKYWIALSKQWQPSRFRLARGMQNAVDHISRGRRGV